NTVLAKKIATLQLRLAPLVPLPEGPPHPDFPKTLMAFHLLTEDQLDSIAHYYHQSTPHRFTHHYPATMNWDKDQADDIQGSSRNPYANLSDKERIRIKRRKVGKFIGLVGMETPIEEVTGRVQASIDRAVERSREELRR
ncbi:uncharacterized protein MYCFIDRAFT_123063, partial [Pseudocercospora fijiensis CIRAD86]